MPNHPNFHVTAFAGVLENAEFEFSSLYLHHFVYGPSPTQSNIISANSTTGWGSTEVNNWPIYDGVGHDAKLVARAQGHHIYAGNWHNMLTIAFEIERYAYIQKLGTFSQYIHIMYLLLCNLLVIVLCATQTRSSLLYKF